MKHYEIRTSCDELIGAGNSIENAVRAALDKISVDDFIDYCTYGDETTEHIESFSMFELHDMAADIDAEVMTYQELCNIMFERGDTNAYITVEKLMNAIEKETGVAQSWSYTAPKWAIRDCLHIAE